MTYGEWEATVPEQVRRDRVWRVEAYRLALFAAEVGWHDATALMRDRRTRGLADQLYRALGSISANVEEGFSRSTGRDRARFYEYELGSARESRGWYVKARHVLGEEVVERRVEALSGIVRLLLTMIPDQRRDGQTLREPGTGYEPGPDAGDAPSA